MSRPLLVSVAPRGETGFRRPTRKLQDDLLQYTQIDPEAEAERAAAEADPAFTFVDLFAVSRRANSPSWIQRTFREAELSLEPPVHA